MFRPRAFSRHGLFLLLIIALGTGPVAHGYSAAPDAPAPTTHEDSHSHDDNGDVVDFGAEPGEQSTGVQSTGEQSNGGIPVHFHLPLTVDHVHDTWLYHAGMDVPGMEQSAFRPHADTHIPQQDALNRIKKPPRFSLKS